MKVSVILAARNEPLLRATVESVLSTGEVDEVVICDDGSDDGCASFPCTDRAKLIRHDKSLGSCVSRNDGAAVATGDVFIFMDGHMLATGSLRPIAEEAIRREAVGCCGICQTYKGTGNHHTGRLIMTKGDWKFEHKWASKAAPDAPRFERITGLVGACYVFPREIFKAIGGWCPNPEVGFDDPTISAKIFFCGYEIFRDLETVVRHQFKKTGYKTDTVMRDLKYVFGLYVLFGDEVWNTLWWPKLRRRFPAVASKWPELKATFEADRYRNDFAQRKVRSDDDFFREALDEPFDWRAHVAGIPAPAPAYMPPRSGNHSFEEVLRDTCRQIKPARVLEWGPGRSTAVIHEECPGAAITSIEHNDAWFARAATRYPYANLVHCRIKGGGPSDYPWWPIKHKAGPFDLIFIDGRQRASCMLTASKVLAAGGRVILHDTSRRNYRHAYDLFKLVEERDRTIVFEARTP